MTDIKKITAVAFTALAASPAAALAMQFEAPVSDMAQIVETANKSGISVKVTNMDDKGVVFKLFEKSKWDLGPTPGMASW